jgi:hypothetical protein
MQVGFPAKVEIYKGKIGLCLSQPHQSREADRKEKKTGDG